MASHARRLRRTLLIARGAVALWPSTGPTQAYPTQPVRIIVPYAPEVGHSPSTAYTEEEGIRGQ